MAGGAAAARAAGAEAAFRPARACAARPSHPPRAARRRPAAHLGAHHRRDPEEARRLRRLPLRGARRRGPGGHHDRLRRPLPRRDRRRRRSGSRRGCRPGRHSKRRSRNIAKIDIPANAAHVYTECARVWNPIHTDIAYARAAGLPNIILHGTATLALSVSRVLQQFDIDAAAVRRVQCRFSGMVEMPSHLSVHAATQDKAVRFETRNSAGETVIGRGGLLLQ